MYYRHTIVVKTAADRCYDGLAGNVMMKEKEAGDENMYSYCTEYPWLFNADQK